MSDDFEYLSAEAKLKFQASINSMLEAHADFVQKITYATGQKKTGIWLEMSEAEILTGHIFECISDLLGSYDTISTTNKHLNARCKALERFKRNDLETTITKYKNNEITEEEFKSRVQMFVSHKNVHLKDLLKSA